MRLCAWCMAQIPGYYNEIADVFVKWVILGCKKMILSRSVLNANNLKALNACRITE